MGGIPESAALCLPAPTLQRPVPAVTALAGPRGLRAPSTRAQQRFLQVLLSSTPRGTTILLLPTLSAPGPSLFSLLLPGSAAQPRSWCWLALPHPHAEMASGPGSCAWLCWNNPPQTSFPSGAKLPLRIPKGCLFHRGAPMCHSAREVQRQGKTVGARPQGSLAVY